MVGVERAEPVDRGRRSGRSGRCGCQQSVERRAEPGRHLLDGELDARARSPSARSVAPKPGTVSISVMSRSKPTTSSASWSGVARSSPGALHPLRSPATLRTSVPALSGGTRTKGALGGWRLGASRRSLLCRRPRRRAGRGPPAPAPGRRRAPRPTLYLVTLDGPGTAGYPGSAVRPGLPRVPGAGPGRRARRGRCRRRLPVDDRPERLRRRAHRRPRPSLLRADTRGRLVEENAVRALAGAPGQRQPRRRRTAPAAARAWSSAWSTPASGPRARCSRRHPAPRPCAASTSAAPATTVRRLGRADACNGKLVGARWFVARLRRGPACAASRSRRSRRPRARHPDGVDRGRQRGGLGPGAAASALRQYAGVAPQARIAVYKACWTAPDPADDGCATADLVTAIDRATRDRVDVLNLVGRRAVRPSTPSSARCSARPRQASSWSAPPATAAGAAYAAHPSPVGDHGRRRRPATSASGPRSSSADGATVAGRDGVHPPGRTGPARPGAGRRGRAVPPEPRPGSARPGSPRRVAHRGRHRALRARRDRAGRRSPRRSARPTGSGWCSSTPARHRRGRPARRPDRPPPRPAAAELLRPGTPSDPHARVTLRPLPTARPRRPDDARGPAPATRPRTLVKPDLVAPALGRARCRPAVGERVPLELRVRDLGGHRLDQRPRGSDCWPAPDWSRGPDPLGAGHLGRRRGRQPLGAAQWRRPARMRNVRTSPGLAYLVRPGDYRAWLEGDLDRDLNTPSILLSERPATSCAGRSRNVSRRAAYLLGPGDRVQRHA